MDGTMDGLSFPSPEGRGGGQGGAGVFPPPRRGEGRRGWGPRGGTMDGTMDGLSFPSPEGRGDQRGEDRDRGTGVAAGTSSNRVVPYSSNDVLNSARSVVSSAAERVTSGAGVNARSGPPRVIVANALSLTLTAICPEPVCVVVSSVTSPAARTTSPPLATRRSVVMRTLLPPPPPPPPPGARVTLSSTCRCGPAPAIPVCSRGVSGDVVESARTVMSRRVVPSVTNPASDAAAAATL